MQEQFFVVLVNQRVIPLFWISAAKQFISPKILFQNLMNQMLYWNTGKYSIIKYVSYETNESHQYNVE